jgi:6-phosphogluconolactonase (cycloisomerase 2 family)
LVLAINGGSNLSVAAKATSFTFPTALASGTAYTVSVLTQPSDPAQTCTLSGASGTVGSGNVTSVTVACTTSDFTVGGTVGGLVGSGLVLANNGGDKITVAAGAKSFTFPTSIASGGAYAVTVATQPSNPVQVCTVTNGSGTVASAAVTTVAVACTTPIGSISYTVGGSIAGLTSAGLVLEDNVGDHLTIAARATSFTFPTLIPGGKPYAVSVLTQPSNPAQVCTVTNGSGTVGTANVTTVSVTCATPTYKVGGTISGLTSGGLVLQNEGGNNLTVPANATTFSFTTALPTGAPYAATVLTQPTTPAEVCTVSNGSGTVAGSAITSISVNCVRVGQFVFVANSIDGASSNGDVSAYTINQTTGALTAVAGSPFALGTNDLYPTAVAVDPNGHAYVANRHSSNVTFFDIANNGVLSLHTDVGGQGTSGTAITVSSGASTYVYVGGYSTSTANGSVSGWLDDPASGDLTPSPNVPYPAETVLNGIAVDPAQQFVYVTSSSHDWVIGFNIGTGGELTQFTDPNNPYSTGQGSPYGVVASPLGTSAGGFLYTTDPSTAKVSQFSYDNTGALTPVAAVATGGAQPEGIAIDPTGKYLYVTNYADGNVTSFSIDPVSGALTPIGSPVNTGNLNAVPNPGPIDVKVDPSGQFVYVVNYLDASVTSFKANAGVLTLVGTYPAGTEATSAAIE